MADAMTVRVGQVFRARPRCGGHLRYIRIAGVSRTKSPRVSWYEVTRNGRRKSPKAAPNHTTFLTFDGRRWVMPAPYEVVDK